MTIYLRGNGEYSKLLHLGESNRNILDLVCATGLALCPILQYYIGPYDNLGISILIAVMPWIAVRLIYKLVRRSSISHGSTAVVIGLIAFLLYRSFAHVVSIENIMFNLVLIVLYISAANGCINVRMFLHTSAAVAATASILVVIQTASYYLMHYHIQLAPTTLFTPEASAWILQAKTGIIGVTQRAGKLYRPSAFFMEPSHMFLYTFPHLCLMLLSPNNNIAKIRWAILFSLGIVLCTSGMGVVVTAGVWGLHYAMSSGRKNQLRLKNLLNPRNFILVLLFLAAVVGAFIAVPVVRQSALRFFDLSESGAIAGRTRLAVNLLRSLRGKQLLFGVTNTLEGIEFNMPGLAATLYKYGIVGVILSFWTYAYGVFKLKNAWFWISLIVVVVSLFSAHTHGTFYMIYYVFFIMEGWNHARLDSVPVATAALDIQRNAKRKVGNAV